MKPTWLAVAAGGGLLAVVGVGVRTPEIATLGLVGVAVALYALVFTRRRIGLDAERRIVPERVAVGEPAALVLRISNPAPWPSPGLVGRSDDGVTVREFYLPPLVAGGSDERSVGLRTDRRGVFTLQPIELLRSDPLRLAGASRRYGTSSTLFVHPRIHPLPALPAASVKEADGIRSDRSFQGSEAFHALRPYLEGDDYRTIHWKSSARLGELVVKQFVDLWQADTLVLLDTRSAVYQGDRFEDAVEAAASVAVAAVSRRHSVTVTLGTQRSATARAGSANQSDLLDLLAGAESGEGEDLTDIVRRVGAERSARAIVLVTGQPPNDELYRFLSATTAAQRRLVVRLTAEPSPLVEMSSRGDEVISANDVAGFVRGWEQLVS